MSFSPAAIDEFKEIYRQDHGLTLTNQEALELAASFLSLMLAIYRPLPNSGWQHMSRDDIMPALTLPQKHP